MMYIGRIKWEYLSRLDRLRRSSLAMLQIKACPLILLDDPAGLLDEADKQAVTEQICSTSARRATIVGIFHNVHVGNAVAAWRMNVATFKNIHQYVMHAIETKKSTLSETIKNSLP